MMRMETKSQGRAKYLIVGHVAGSGAELGVTLDDLVDRLEEVLFRRHLSASSNGVHARLRAHAAQLCA